MKDIRIGTIGCGGIANGVHLPGMEFEPHVHPLSEELVFCFEGEGECYLYDKCIPVKAGDVLMRYRVKRDEAAYKQLELTLKRSEEDMRTEVRAREEAMAQLRREISLQRDNDEKQNDLSAFGTCNAAWYGANGDYIRGGGRCGVFGRGHRRHGG